MTNNSLNKRKHMKVKKHTGLRNSFTDLIQHFDSLKLENGDAGSH